MYLVLKQNGTSEVHGQTQIVIVFHVNNGSSSGDFRLYQNGNQVTGSPFSTVASAESFLNGQSSSSNETVTKTGDSIILYPVARETEVRDNNDNLIMTMSAGTWVFILDDYHAGIFYIYNYSSSNTAQIAINHSINFTDSNNNIFNKNLQGTSNGNFGLFQNNSSVTGSPFSTVTTAQNFLDSQTASSTISVTNNDGDTITLIPVGTETEIRDNNNNNLFTVNAGDWLFIGLNANTNTFNLYSYTSDFKATLTPNYTLQWTDSSNNNFTHENNGTFIGDFRLYQDGGIQVTQKTFTSVASAKSFLNSQSTSSDRIVNNSGDTITLIPVARPTEVRNNNNDTLLNTLRVVGFLSKKIIMFLIYIIILLLIKHNY